MTSVFFKGTSATGSVSIIEGAMIVFVELYLMATLNCSDALSDSEDAIAGGSFPVFGLARTLGISRLSAAVSPIPSSKPAMPRYCTRTLDKEWHPILFFVVSLRDSRDFYY